MMISVRFSGAVAVMQQLRTAITAAGGRASYRANEDGVSARLYVSYQAEDLLLWFTGQAPPTRTKPKARPAAKKPAAKTKAKTKAPALPAKPKAKLLVLPGGRKRRDPGD